MDLIGTALITIVCVVVAARYRQRFALPFFSNFILFLAGSAYLYGYSLYRASSQIEAMLGPGILLVARMAVLVGLIGVMAGYAMSMSRATPGWAGRSAAPLRAHRAGIVGTVLGVAGVMGEVAFIRISGGAEAYFSQTRGGGAYEETTAYLYSARWLLVPGIAFLILAGVRKRAWRRGATFVLVLFVGYNVWLGQRSGWAAGVFLALSAWTAWRRRMPGLSAVALATLATLLGVAMLRSVRDDLFWGSSFERVKEVSEDPAGFVGNALVGGVAETEGLGFTEETEIVLFARFLSVIPERVDFDYFAYYLDFGVVWIPRILWPERPSFSRPKIEELLAVLGTSHRSGPTPTMIGMYYLHLGLPGVLLLSLFTGWFLAVLDRGVLAIPNGSGTALAGLALPAAGLSMPIGLGPLASVPSVMPFVVVPVVLGWLLCRGGGPETQWSGVTAFGRPDLQRLGQRVAAAKDRETVAVAVTAEPGRSR